MDKIVRRYIDIIDKDPAIDTVNGFTGGGRGGATNSARMFISLKPLQERKVSADDVINRLRPKLARVPGATCFVQSSQDLRVGGRQSNAQYQFTMRDDNVEDLNVYGPRMLDQLRQIPLIVDTNTDQQNRGLQAWVQYDRATAARFGISSQLIDNTLYDAFGMAGIHHVYDARITSYGVGAAVPVNWIYSSRPMSARLREPGAAQRWRGSRLKTPALAVSHQARSRRSLSHSTCNPRVPLGDAGRQSTPL
jgi:multidrug efflux pump